MVRVAVDSSVLIEEGRRGSAIYEGLLKAASLGRIELALPVVVVMELWAGKSMEKVSVLKAMESRIKSFKVLDLTIAAAKEAGKIRREIGMGGVDAMVAAVCLVNKCQLATLNTKHFVGIKGLKLYNLDK